MTRHHLSTNWLDKCLPVNGAELAYAVRPGRGPTVMLLPGSFSDRRQWASVVEALLPEDHVILAEVRGHGRSKPVPDRGSVEQFASDVVAVLCHERAERVYLGGHSIGGMIAMEAARQAPDRIAGVVALEGWVHARAADMFAGAMYSTLSAEQSTRMAELREMATGHWSEPQRAAFRQIYLRWQHGESFLKETSLPVLAIHGDRGRDRPSRGALLLPDRPNIDLRFMCGASHELPLERPRAVAAWIDSFCRPCR